jgi:predicted nucleic acid-binding protein
VIPPALVVDASVGIKWVVEESNSDLARSLARAKLEAPDLFLIECANILWKKVRAGDLTARAARASLQVVLDAPVTIMPSRELLADAIELSIRLQHPVYDCVYIALAVRRQAPLVTADEKLAMVVRRTRKLSGQLILLRDLKT